MQGKARTGVIPLTQDAPKSSGTYKRIGTTSLGCSAPADGSQRMYSTSLNAVMVCTIAICDPLGAAAVPATLVLCTALNAAICAAVMQNSQTPSVVDFKAESAASRQFIPRRAVPPCASSRIVDREEVCDMTCVCARVCWVSAYAYGYNAAAADALTPPGMKRISVPSVLSLPAATQL